MKCKIFKLATRIIVKKFQKRIEKRRGQNTPELEYGTQNVLHDDFVRNFVTLSKFERRLQIYPLKS